MSRPLHACGSLVVLSLLSSTAALAADEEVSQVAAMRYVELGVLSDNADNREWRATAGLTAGNHVWLRAAVGRGESQLDAGAVESSLTSGGLGIRGEHLQFSVNFSSRKDGDSYEQRDWTGSIGWRNDTFGIAVDGMTRDTATRTLQTVTRPILGPITVAVDQSIEGRGLGLHADLNLTERLNVFGAGMSYSYDEVATNRPALARLLNFNGSGITREQAILDRSFSVGLSQQFGPLDLTVQYFNDKALADGDITHTSMASAAIFLGVHWVLTPSVGHSSNPQLGGSTFGALSLTYGW